MVWIEMSEAAMSPEGRQQIATMRDQVAAENAAHETVYVMQIHERDVLDLMSGYVNLTVRGKCALMLADQDQARADRPVRKGK
jgi:hypothetical protein